MNIQQICTVLLATLLLSLSDTHAQNGGDTTKLVRGGASRSRSLFCIPIPFLWDCDDEDDEDDEDTAAEEDNADDEDDDDDEIDPWCWGIFRTCKRKNDDGEIEEFDLFADSNRNYTDCREATDGLFGGRRIFGDCGILAEIVENVFNSTDTDGDGDTDQITIGNIFADSDNENSTEPFGLGVFPEGGLLYRIFNREEDETLIDSVLQEFRNNTNQFTNGFLEEWSGTANVSDATCNNTATAPDCLDLLGQDGFWACRTLMNPFTRDPSSKSVCLGKGEFLENNDDCGCCGNECPKTCPCKCQLGDDDDEDEGVWVSTQLFGELAIETCVTASYAVTMTSRLDGISCVEDCSLKDD